LEIPGLDRIGDDPGRRGEPVHAANLRRLRHFAWSAQVGGAPMLDSVEKHVYDQSPH
jgi:hypothetical protein